jgi:integrase
MATGIRKRHSRKCRIRRGGATCDCRPSWEAWVWSRRHQAKISRTFATESAAKTWRADATSAASRGRLRPATRTTVRQATEALVKGMEDGSVLNRRRRPYKPSTRRAYARALGLEPEQRQRAPERLLERLGDYRLSELDRAAVQDYVNRLRAAGYDPSTVGNMLDPLRVILRRARQRGELATDPLEGLELEKPTGRRMRIAQPAEAAVLLDALDEDDQALWATFLYAGVRRGEARATRVLDLDLKARTIRVERSWDDVEGEQDDGKSDAAERTIPLLGPLPALLRAHLMRTGRRSGDLLFGETATEPFEPTSVRRRALAAWGWDEVRDHKPGQPRWVKARPDALKPITPHECRHTYASLLIAAGTDIKRVSEFMGHSSISITADRYGHLFPDARDETIRRVDAYLAAQQAPEARLKGLE